MLAIKASIFQNCKVTIESVSSIDGSCRMAFDILIA